MASAAKQIETIDMPPLSQMKLQKQQIKAVLTLEGPERYENFIKQVADKEVVWGLYQEGWALAETSDGQRAFPLWPAAEYAALCARHNWEGYQPRSFPLSDLMDKFLPRFAEDGTLPAIFFTPQKKGVTPSVQQLRADLERELDRY
jgi:hypothetical protein